MSTPPLLLVIDDNRELVENLGDIFAPRGFSVRAERDAAAGLARARASGFDLAFVDVNLPDSSGLDLLPALRAASPLGEVILMTGHASIDTAIAAVRGGAFHYVVKPFKPDDLIATAESALRQVGLRVERARLARQLEVSERRYRDVVESAQVLVAAIDAGGRLRMINRRVAELTGYASPELEGEPFVDRLVSPELRDTVRERLDRAAAAGAPAEFEAPLVSRDGRARLVRWHASPTFSHERAEGDGEPSMYVVGADVTERRELERRAAEAEALAHMGTLAAGLAHEIRNPLNAAGLQLHLLSRSVDKLRDEDRGGLRGRVDIVASELKRLERLLSDFLELARPRPIARLPTDMPALLGEVIAFHEPAAQTRGVALLQKLGPGVAIGDRERLRQVLHNLLVNAIEATTTGDSITVECYLDATDPPSIVLILSDTGRGIPAATLNKVFEPFFTTKEAGTGLGLTIVRTIIERHGGSVAIASGEGRGTRITIRLPAAEPAATSGP